MASDHFEQLRHLMVTTQLQARGVSDVTVLEAMRSIPRHLFVPQEIIPYAYDDSALPLTQGQTISQPYIVGLMTALAKPSADQCALEVGTGSGYQTAILAALCESVTTIEVLSELSKSAKERLDALGYTNIAYIVGDGHQGCMEHAPYDIILVTACAKEVPMALVDQLKENGRMVIPIGHDTQYLTLVTKGVGREVVIERILPVRFVPMIHT